MKMLVNIKCLKLGIFCLFCLQAYVLARFVIKLAIQQLIGRINSICVLFFLVKCFHACLIVFVCMCMCVSLHIPTYGVLLTMKQCYPSRVLKNRIFQTCTKQKECPQNVLQHSCVCLHVSVRGCFFFRGVGGLFVFFTKIL